MSDIASKDPDRHLLPRRTRGLIALSALVTLDRMDDFEDQARSEVAAGIAPMEILDMLLELADLGVRVPQRAFKIVHGLT